MSSGSHASIRKPTKCFRYDENGKIVRYERPSSPSAVTAKGTQQESDEVPSILKKDNPFKTPEKDKPQKNSEEEDEEDVRTPQSSTESSPSVPSRSALKPSVPPPTSTSPSTLSPSAPSPASPSPSASSPAGPSPSAPSPGGPSPSGPSPSLPSSKNDHSDKTSTENSAETHNADVSSAIATCEKNFDALVRNPNKNSTVFPSPGPPMAVQQTKKTNSSLSINSSVLEPILDDVINGTGQLVTLNLSDFDYEMGDDVEKGSSKSTSSNESSDEEEPRPELSMKEDRKQVADEDNDDKVTSAHGSDDGDEEDNSEDGKFSQSGEVAVEEVDEGDANAETEQIIRTGYLLYGSDTDKEKAFANWNRFSLHAVEMERLFCRCLDLATEHDEKLRDDLKQVLRNYHRGFSADEDDVEYVKYSLILGESLQPTMDLFDDVEKANSIYYSGPDDSWDKTGLRTLGNLRPCVSPCAREEYNDSLEKLEARDVETPYGITTVQLGGKNAKCFHIRDGVIMRMDHHNLVMRTVAAILDGKARGAKPNGAEMTNAFVKLWDLLVLALWPGPTANFDFIIHPVRAGHKIEFNTTRIEVMLYYLKLVWDYQLNLIKNSLSAQKKTRMAFDYNKFDEKFDNRVRHMKNTLRNRFASQTNVSAWHKDHFKSREYYKFINGKAGINMALKSDSELEDDDDAEDKPKKRGRKRKRTPSDSEDDDSDGNDNQETSNRPKKNSTKSTKSTKSKGPKGRKCRSIISDSDEDVRKQTSSKRQKKKHGVPSGSKTNASIAARGPVENQTARRKHDGQRNITKISNNRSSHEGSSKTATHSSDEDISERSGTSSVIPTLKNKAAAIQTPEFAKNYRIPRLPLLKDSHVTKNPWSTGSSEPNPSNQRKSMAGMKKPKVLSPVRAPAAPRKVQDIDMFAMPGAPETKKKKRKETAKVTARNASASKERVDGQSTAKSGAKPKNSSTENAATSATSASTKKLKKSSAITVATASAPSVQPVGDKANIEARIAILSKQLKNLEDMRAAAQPGE